MEFNIKGFVDISLVDWDGKVSSVIFLPNCNFRCPFCQNAKLVLKPNEIPTIGFEEIKSRLERLKKWIDGAVITGGEPTLHKELKLLCRKLKNLGFSVKLDTNGTNPKMLQELINEKLIDYIALDIKAPLNPKKYSEAVGVSSNEPLKKILESIGILRKENIEYELRTTVVPSIHTEQDIEEICKSIEGCPKYVIQNFRPTEDMINPKFRNIKPFSRKQLEKFRENAKKYLSNVVLRA
ncbi:anaerobic ribonucleoside-triphosphate reductase activating protein [Candidatus Bathyarchaeota archaeon]|nr:MAG: anaerobic ribonucleoside-triphosphate reductase activating protein [Candidatus Bathyarchaeota archaeon]